MSRFDSLATIQHTLTTNFLEAAIDGLMVVITLVMMFVYSIKLAVIGLIAAGLYAILRWRLYGTARRAAEELLVKTAKQQGHFLETVRGMQAIKLRAREDRRSAGWQNLTVDQFNAQIRTQRFDILYQALHGLLFGIDNVATIWLGALMVMAADSATPFTLGMLFAFLAYKLQFVQRAGDLVEKGIELRMLGLHAERVGDIVTVPRERYQVSTTPHREPANASFELIGLSFRYAPSMPWIIRNLDLRIAGGESVALIGPSGCGKTTLVKLMLGLLEPETGTIAVGGVPIAELGLVRYRRMVASVMQDDQLCAGSIEENICFFDPQPDLERIKDCARLAAVDEDIDAMPMKYATLVGDMGTVLSGGQKQRILLARALYTQPRILFLDEATSHLDVACEQAVNQSIRALHITRVIVAHRPATIAMADRVVTLQRLVGAAT